MELIDCDGIVSPDTPLSAQVAGTPEYQAPELVSGERREPWEYTDRHALAVMIYRLLFYIHPLKGRRDEPRLRHPNLARGSNVSTEEEDQYAMGKGALYIFDPHEPTYRPRPPLLNPRDYGAQIGQLCDEAFLSGLHFSTQRPTARKWEAALTRIYDRIIPCSNPICRQRFFVAPEMPGTPLCCQLCGHTLTGPQSIPYLALERLVPATANGSAYYVDEGYTMVGWPGRTLHAWHLSSDITPMPADGRTYDPQTVGHFEYDAVADIWYLVNDRMPHLLIVGGPQKVPLGSQVPLSDGLQIWLDGTAGARRATIQIASCEPGETIFMLPEEDNSSTKPWPHLVPQPTDIAWHPGQPITLRRYRGPSQIIQDDSRPPQIAWLMTQAIIAILCAFAAFLIYGGGLQAWAFWTQPLALVIGAVVLLGSVIFRILFGIWNGFIFWAILTLGFFIQLAIFTYRVPPNLTIGAIIGCSFGALIFIFRVLERSRMRVSH